MIDFLSICIAYAGFLTAVIFGIAGVAGLFRFPDPYARLQAGSLCGTTAVFSIFIACIAIAPERSIAARIIIIGIIFLVSAPTASHIVARFTWNSGIMPWRPKGTKRSADMYAQEKAPVKQQNKTD